MPFLNVKTSREVKKSEREELTKLLLDTTQNVLKKQRAVTAIAIEEIKGTYWCVGDSVVDEIAINFEISITKGTNSAEQKAQYQKEVFQGLKKIFPKLLEVSYITIRDIEGDSWGFNGISQKARAFM